MKYVPRKTVCFVMGTVLFSVLSACGGGGDPHKPPPPSPPPEKECTIEMVEQRIDLDKARAEVAFETARDIDRNGRILTYQHFLFVNDYGMGFHIFDNTDPAKPIALGFMRVPGNFDISIRNDLLYADSYIDLVVIGLSAEGEPTVIERNNNVFDGQVKNLSATENGAVVTKKFLLWRDARKVKRVCR